MAALRVDDDGLVVVTPEELQGFGVPVGAPVGRVDLEDVTVVPGHAVDAGPVGVLLAGEPGAPRGAAARAVGGGARDADPLGDPAVGAHLDDGAAAGRGGVVDQALGERHGVGPVGARALQLVVVDEEGGAAGAVEGGRAVVVGGGELARLQAGLPAVGDDPVAEAGGQREDAPGVGEQRSVSDAAVPGRRGAAGVRAGLRVRGREGVRRAGEVSHAARQRDARAGERGAGGEVPAGERHGVS